MELVYERKTAKSLAEALVSLRENLNERAFGVLWELNFKDKLGEHGLSFEEDFVVLEVCNPQQAKEVLERNSQIGYVLPCKMVVRTEKGTTYIGMTNPERLIALFEDNELGVVAKQVAQVLTEAVFSVAYSDLFTCATKKRQQPSIKVCCLFLV